MYTEFHFNVELKKDIPDEVWDVLEYMTGVVVEEPERLPEHPLFGDTRWRFMLRCSSAYFPHDTATSFYTAWADKAPFLNVRCNLKNYNDEIELFIHWIAPYVVETSNDFVGFYRYEASEHPTLIYISHFLED